MWREEKVWERLSKKLKANGVADRLPSLKKDNGVADMLPALKRGGHGFKITWSNEEEKIARKMSAKLVHKKWEIVKICLNTIEENCDKIKPQRKNERKYSLE